MRAREIILELRQYLDPTKYGAWINAKTKEIHYVIEGGHQDWMIEYLYDHPNLPRFGDTPEEKVKQGGEYESGFINHFVRVVHDTPEDFYVTGMGKDLAAVRHIIMGTAAQQDTDWVTVDRLTDPDDRTRGIEFRMPQSRIKLIKYLTNGATE